MYQKSAARKEAELRINELKSTCRLANKLVATGSMSREHISLIQQSTFQNFFLRGCAILEGYIKDILDT